MTDVALPAGDRSLLIVEDDKLFLARLARAMETRGFKVTTPRRWPTVCSRSSRTRRPSRWSTCGSATATAST